MASSKLAYDKKRQITCCPECHSHEIAKRKFKRDGGKYKCYGCKATFDNPITRNVLSSGPKRKAKVGSSK